MSQSQPLHLIGAKGGGSAIVEAVFTQLEIPYEVEYLEWDALHEPDNALMKANPLGEIPTLILPDGTVLTESAAITLWAADQRPGSSLVPAPGHALRTPFLRWLIWLVSAVYPTFVYGDMPTRYLSTQAGADELRASTDEWRKRLWRQLELQVSPSPWLLGDELTALDLFLAPMSRWRPGRKWLEQECPKVFSAAEAALKMPALQPIWERNQLL